MGQRWRRKSKFRSKAFEILCIGDDDMKKLYAAVLIICFVLTAVAYTANATSEHGLTGAAEMWPRLEQFSSESGRPFDIGGFLYDKPIENRFIGYDRQIALTLRYLKWEWSNKDDMPFPFTISIAVFSSSEKGFGSEELIERIRSDIQSYEGPQVFNYGYMDERIIVIIDADTYQTSILFDELNPVLLRIDFGAVENILNSANELHFGIGLTLVAIADEIFTHFGYEMTERLAIWLALLEEPWVVEHRIVDLLKAVGFNLLGFDDVEEGLYWLHRLLLDYFSILHGDGTPVGYWPFEELPELTERQIGLLTGGYGEEVSLLEEHMALIMELCPGTALTPPDLTMTNSGQSNNGFYIAAGILFLVIIAIVLKKHMWKM